MNFYVPSAIRHTIIFFPVLLGNIIGEKGGGGNVWWRATFSDGKEDVYLESIFCYYKIEDAEREAKLIEETIGFEEYARTKGIDLRRWKFCGVWLVTHTKQ